MSIEDKKLCKLAYIEALKVSPVSRDNLKYLHKVNDNTLDKWLYVPDRYPPFQACYELYLLLRKQKMFVCPKLARIVTRSVNRASVASARMGTPTDAEKEGEPLAVSKGWVKSSKTFLYHDKVVRISELSEIFNLGFSRISLLIRKHNIGEGESVDFFDSLKRNNKSYKPRTFLLNGEVVTIGQIAAAYHLSKTTVDSRIHSRKKKSGDDISDVDFNRYAFGGPKRITDDN